MKWILLFVGLSFIIFASCDKGITNVPLHGLYTEIRPVPGRSRLEFISNDLLVKSELGSSYEDTFKYSVSANKITLTPNWTNQVAPKQLDFKIIDEASFQMENLYPDIPEFPESYIIYKK
jgi:hypothetical protein